MNAGRCVDDDRATADVILTTIELCVLHGLADGLHSKEIAARISRSAGTVEFYVRTLYLKLQARSRAQLVARAFERGYLTPRTRA
ncbi:MAG TPA: LuxR C-terminal-related transcriptional regulator [Candidatus Elarobacter sp.]|nr:LuxR C-terminal-related transcriptional regulator [Candidatus Elarobacter sp.]